MAVIKFGYQLTQALRNSGTGEGKLEILRDFIAKNPTASAEDALAHLTKSGRAVPDTIAKARHLIDHGRVPDPVQVVRPANVEDEIAKIQVQAEAERRVRADAAEKAKAAELQSKIDAEKALALAAEVNRQAAEKAAKDAKDAQEKAAKEAQEADAKRQAEEAEKVAAEAAKKKK